CSARVGFGRRIWRSCGLCWRACARSSPRLLYQFHSDYRRPGIIRFFAGNPDHAILDARPGFSSLWLADSLPSIPSISWSVAIHPPENEGITDFQLAEGCRHEFHSAAERCFYELAQSRHRAGLVVWSYCRARSSVVLLAVLCPFLSANHTQDQSAHG